MVIVLGLQSLAWPGESVQLSKTRHSTRSKIDLMHRTAPNRTAPCWEGKLCPPIGSLPRAPHACQQLLRPHCNCPLHSCRSKACLWLFRALNAEPQAFLKLADALSTPQGAQERSTWK